MLNFHRILKFNGIFNDFNKSSNFAGPKSSDEIPSTPIIAIITKETIFNTSRIILIISFILEYTLFVQLFLLDLMKKQR